MEADDSYISVDLRLDGDRPEFGDIDYAHALRPVTIRQLRQAQRAHDDAPFTIDGKELNQIVVVASLLRETAFPNTRSVRYAIDDGTGCIDVWRTFAQSRRKGDHRHDNAEAEGGEEWEAGWRLNADYVRVVGKLHQRNGSFGPTIQGTSVQGIGNFAEVTHHMLAAITVTTWYERGAPPPDVIDGARRKAENHAIKGGPSTAEMSTSATRLQTPPHTDVQSQVPQRSDKPPTPQVVSTSARKPSSVPLGASTNDISSPTPSASSAKSSSTLASGPPPTSHNASASKSNTHSNQAIDHSVAVEFQQPYASSSSYANTTAPAPSQPHQGAQDRELGRDPLSSLTVAARQIMLEVMDSAHNTASSGCVYVDVLARSVKQYEGITTADIEKALDQLIEMGMIEMADDEGLWYRATGDVAYSGVHDFSEEME